MTTILNSSGISDTNELICFMRRSTDASAPVFSNVVMASVAASGVFPSPLQNTNLAPMERFGSVINCSKSILHAATAAGCAIEIFDNVRTAAKRCDGFGEEQNSCNEKYHYDSWYEVHYKPAAQKSPVPDPWRCSSADV